MESAKIVGALARLTRDVGVAEELAQDAFLAALEQWPQSGVPDNPGAWLMGSAKHRALDFHRRGKMLDKKHEQVAHEMEVRQEAGPEEIDSALDDNVGDDVLRLIFVACHPVLSTDSRAALTLRVVGGLSTEEIARAFLSTVPTVQQRIVRAKKTIADAKVPFEVPRGSELADRVASVLEVLYLIFNEGYSATAGDDWLRPTLCEEALRLGRVLAELMPNEAEVHGLVALMELQASRTRARTNRNGEPILLLEQNRAQWDHLLIRRGITALARAESIGGELEWYGLQAAIAACHALARTAEDTNWSTIVELYGELDRMRPSPVVKLNRAVAVGMASGPEAGLKEVDALLKESSLRGYHLLPSVRGDFLFKLGRFDEAAREFDKAAELTSNARERKLLSDRAARSRAPH